MRKFLLSLFCILATMPAFADYFHYSYEGQTLEYFTTSTEECAVGSNYPITGDVTVPEKVIYNGAEYKVTSLGEWAFDGCNSLTSITLPCSLTSIGDYAFTWCENLTSITIPESVTSIGNSAFEDCRKLKSITLPDAVTSIEPYAFEDCKSLESINIPNSVTSIGKWAFTDCTNLESVIIPDSVTFIDYCGFYGCKNLKSVTLSNSITSIEPHTFAYCYKLESITIPNSVTSIDDGAFFDCSSLTSVTLGSGLKSIKQESFASCENLTEVTSLAVNPPTVINNDDYLPRSQCTLYVPQGSEEAYRNAFWWKEFTSIQSETTSSPTISSDAHAVKAENGNIIISNVKIGAQITIYDVTGEQVAKTEVANTIESISVKSKGVFLVNVDDLTYKVSL